MMRRMDVYEATEKRLKIIFDYFDYVYVSFSGGKDSGVHVWTLKGTQQ